MLIFDSLSRVFRTQEEERGTLGTLHETGRTEHSFAAGAAGTEARKDPHVSSDGRVLQDTLTFVPKALFLKVCRGVTKR